MRKFVVAGAIFISGLCLPGLLPAKEVNFDQIIRALAPGVQGAYENLQRSIDLEIQFETNSATLTKQARKQLAVLAKALVSDHLSGSQYIIAGHTDARGAPAYNKALSLKRAKAVVDHLEHNFKINRARFVAKGYGEERLKDTVNIGASINRRVEITLIHETHSPTDTGEDKLELAPGAGSPKSESIKW
ncbi:MAG: hypothetical protein CMF66_08595 [Magnetovibrio sp.]|nr:hypothetical protein [Magnetovibrio sp.]|tara:strand:+ start:547 stop:1113 length:567 start_codon:yes stop_codon:yes gene_type:complete